jgi:hypothetical protein
MMKQVLCLLLVSLSFSCSKSNNDTPADPRDQYVGTYQGSASVLLSGQPLALPGSVNVTKTASSANGLTLDYQGQQIPSTLNNNTLTIPSTSVNFLGTGYNLTGAGAFSGNKLQVGLSGTSSGTVTAPFSLTFSGTK